MNPPNLTLLESPILPPLFLFLLHLAALKNSLFPLSSCLFLTWRASSYFSHTFWILLCTSTSTVIGCKRKRKRGDFLPTYFNRFGRCLAAFSKLSRPRGIYLTYLTYCTFSIGKIHLSKKKKIFLSHSWSRNLFMAYHTQKSY